MKYLIYTIGLIYLLISFNYGINIYDEGITLVGGMRVLGGELPYKDFWTIYPPGIFYLSALLQLITKSLWLHKLIAVLSIFVIALNLNRIYTLLTNRTNTFTFIIVVVLAGFGLKYLNSSMIGLLFVVLAITEVLKYYRTGKVKKLFYSGLLIGLTSFFRHDFAIYLIIPLALSLLFEKGSTQKLKNFSIIFLGLLPFVVLYVVFTSYTGFDKLMEHLIVFPLTKFDQVRNLPFPLIWNAKEVSDSLSNYLYNTWVAIVFLVPPVVAIASYLIHRKNTYVSLYIFYGLALLLFYNQALNRSDFAHLIPSILLSIPLICALIGLISTKFYLKLVVLFFVIIVLLIPFGKKLNYAKQYYLKNSLTESNFQKLNYIYIDSELENRYSYLAELDKYIIKRRPTFIGIKDMSRIEANDVLAYYILGWQPKTKYHELHPGISDNLYFQKQILEELENRNNYVILLDLESGNNLKGSSYLNDNLTKSYRYIIKTSKLELLSNKKNK